MFLRILYSVFHILSHEGATGEFFRTNISKQSDPIILTGNVPLTRLGLPLGYGFPGMIPQDEIIAIGALQPTLHT